MDSRQVPGDGQGESNPNTTSTGPSSQQNALSHLNDTVNSLDPLNAMEKSLNDQMPHTPNTPHTPGNGGSASHPMTPIGGPPSVNNGPNHSPQQQQQHSQQHSMGGGDVCATNTSNNQGLNMYEPDLTTELGFIDGNGESDLNVSRRWGILLFQTILIEFPPYSFSNCCYPKRTSTPWSCSITWTTTRRT